MHRPVQRDHRGRAGQGRRTTAESRAARRVRELDNTTTSLGGRFAPGLTCCVPGEWAVAHRPATPQCLQVLPCSGHAEGTLPSSRAVSRCLSPWWSSSSVLARTRHPSRGVHPLAVGHPPGSGLGPAGEGGAPHCLTDLRPRGQVCEACPGRWREGESPPQPGTDGGCSGFPGPSLSLRPRRRQVKAALSAWGTVPGVRGSPRWCREDPAVCRVGSRVVKH